MENIMGIFVWTYHGVFHNRFPMVSCNFIGLTMGVLMKCHGCMIKIQPLILAFLSNEFWPWDSTKIMGPVFFRGDLDPLGDPLIMVDRKLLEMGSFYELLQQPRIFGGFFWVVDLWWNLGEIIFGVQRSRCHAMHGTHATLTFFQAQSNPKYVKVLTWKIRVKRSPYTCI